MRISYWSSDVCSSDLSAHSWLVLPNLRNQHAFSVGSEELALHRVLPKGHIWNCARRSVPVWSYDACGALLDSALSNKIGKHTSELQSLMRISYAVFCLKKKNTYIHHTPHTYTTIIITI